jgi:SpoVK/Ycf46/Vps4 family AAA+-type ATPase
MFRLFSLEEPSNLLCQQAVKKWIETDLNFPFNNGLPLPKGVLFYGEPGNGKTVCAKNVASHLSCISGKKWSLFSYNCSHFLKKYIGEGEKKLRKCFENANSNSPCILFFDEIDAICSKRSNDSDQCYVTLTSAFLSLFNDVEKNVVVIGATNRLESIDFAFRRFGRFQHTVFFGYPSCFDRFQFLKHFLGIWPCSANLSILAKQTVGYSVAQLHELVEMAIRIRCKDGTYNIQQCHFEQYLKPCLFSSSFLKKISLHTNVKKSTLFTGKGASHVVRALEYLHGDKFTFMRRLGTTFLSSPLDTETLLDDARFSGKLLVAYEEFDWTVIEPYFECIIYVPDQKFAI